MSFFRFIFLGLVIMTQLIHCTNKNLEATPTKIHGLSYFEILDTLKGIWYVDTIHFHNAQNHASSFNDIQRNGFFIYNERKINWREQNNYLDVFSIQDKRTALLIRLEKSFNLLQDSSIVGYKPRDTIQLKMNSSWDSITAYVPGNRFEEAKFQKVTDTIYLKKASPIIKNQNPLILSKLHETNWRSKNQDIEYQISFFIEDSHKTILKYTIFERDTLGYFAQTALYGYTNNYNDMCILQTIIPHDYITITDMGYDTHLGHIPNANDNIFDNKKITFGNIAPLYHQQAWKAFAHPIQYTSSVNLLYYNAEEQLCIISQNREPIVFERDTFDQKAWKNIWDSHFEKQNQTYNSVKVSFNENNYISTIDYFPYFISHYTPSNYKQKTPSKLYLTSEYMLSPCHDYIILSNPSMDSSLYVKHDYNNTIKHRQLNVKCLPIKRTSLEEFEKTGIPFHFIEEN